MTPEPDFRKSLERLNDLAASIEQVLADPKRVAAVQSARHEFPAEVNSIIEAVQGALGVEFVGLSLVTDVEREFFASSIPVNTCANDYSHCQWVVGSGQALAINDARSKQVQRLMPKAFAEYDIVRAYLGVPLRDTTGHVLGALCAISVSGPRDWRGEDVVVLSGASSRITDLLSPAP